MKHSLLEKPWLPWSLVALLIGAVGWFAGRSSLPKIDAASTALAQSPNVAGARGVFAFTGPLDVDRYGLFMIDIEQGTIWVYELEGTAGARKLRLAAARTWLYDRYLKDFNSAVPSFREVQALVARERAQLSATRGSEPAEPPAQVEPRLEGPRSSTIDPTRLPGAGGG